MLTAEQAIRTIGTAGDPLPSPWRSLSAIGASFLRGQLVLIAAGSGTGKSAFVLSYAVQAGIPTFYVSADSDPFVQITRLISVTSGCRLSESAAQVRAGINAGAAGAIHRAPIRFSFDAAPTCEGIRASLEAYAETYGEYPWLVVIDNITNVRTDLNADDPFAGLEVLLDEFHELARITGSCVVCLHHVTGPNNDGNKPIPLSGVKGQVARVPELVLTLHRPDEQTLCVSPVKNRAGRMDTSGRTFVPLRFDGETMQIADLV